MIVSLILRFSTFRASETLLSNIPHTRHISDTVTLILSDSLYGWIWLDLISATETHNTKPKTGTTGRNEPPRSSHRPVSLPFQVTSRWWRFPGERWRWWEVRWWCYKPGTVPSQTFLKTLSFGTLWGTSPSRWEGQERNLTWSALLTPPHHNRLTRSSEGICCLLPF